MNEEKRKNRPVFLDAKALREEQEAALGRPLTEQENEIISMAVAISIDAMACGRTVEETVTNMGEVSDGVKAFLGLIPPTN
jgi:putative Mn2+ efflux pump MntP